MSKEKLKLNIKNLKLFIDKYDDFPEAEFYLRGDRDFSDKLFDIELRNNFMKTGKYMVFIGKFFGDKDCVCCDITDKRWKELEDKV